MKARKTKQAKSKATLSTVLADARSRALLENYVDEIIRNKLAIAEAQDAIKTLKASAVDALNLDAVALGKFITALVEGDDGSSAEVVDALAIYEEPIGS